MTTSQTPILRSYVASGLAIIPVLRDGSKAAAVPWTVYQEQAPTWPTVERWIAEGHEGWALICGKVSGNVEAIDFDDPDLFQPWAEQIPGDLLNALVIAETPRGGRHVFYRCREIAGNQKLARRQKDDGTITTLIETRGEGGIILVEPTAAAYHNAGRPYRIIAGSLTRICEISPQEREILLTSARVLTEYYPEPIEYRPQEQADNEFVGERPGDQFEAEVSWAEVLEPHGWRPLRQYRDKTIWQRPGKSGPGGSAQTGGKSQRTGFSGLWVYSSNAAPLESDRGYSKFSAYTALNFGGDFSAAAKHLASLGYGRQRTVIIRPRKEPPLPEPTPEIPDNLDALRNVDVPPLADAAYLDPALSVGVCPWLERYEAFSRLWSPRAFDDFHVACGLWLLSTVAARRVVLHMGGPRYTNLYIALVARTSLWAKSTTAKVVTQTLSEAGLSFLLAPDDSTPQRFISDLVLRVPKNWGDLDNLARQYATRRMAFPAARGWFYEELGQKIDAMLAPGGFMADFRGILRAFDDCPERYEYASIGRGLDPVQNPYVAMLGNMTPADLRRAMRKNDALWQDGFWARWAFVTPPSYVNSSRARFPIGERSIPNEIVQPIKDWHERLGVPQVEVERRCGADGKETDEWEVFADPTAREFVTIDQDASEAFYTYHDALLDALEHMDTQRDFDGNYARFAEKALRVAILVASLEGHRRITLPVWTLAQNIAERWRRSLHELYAQANEPEPSEEIQREEQAMEVITRHGEMTAAEVARYIRNVSSSEAAMILDGLVHAGALIRVSTTKRGTVRYAIAP